MNPLPPDRSISNMLRRWSVRGLALLTVWVPVEAIAQSLPPPAVLKKNPPAWLGMLVMFVLLGLVVAVSLLPAKRGHQD